MKHPMMHSRRVRYGGMTVSLTATLIAALVLLNIIFSTLAHHRGWYIDMTPDKLYSVSDLCHELLEDSFEEAEEEGEVKAEIIFAQNYNTYEVGSVGRYIVDTAKELAQSYPDIITLDWFDCWLDKSLAEELGVRNSNSVVLRVTRGDGSVDSRVFFQQEFFTFAQGNTTDPIGYDGERVFATTLSSLLGGDRPMVCFTVNHDEAFYDQTLVYLLRDAGYNVMLTDLYYEDIPEECELLVMYNPNADVIVADGISDRSELDKLEAYLESGRDMMVYLSANTPEMANLEGFLAEWGFAVSRDYDELTEKSYNCMVKDATAALTSDGFTILGEYAAQGQGAAITTKMTDRAFVPRVVFRDATALALPEGYAAAGESTYQSGDKTRSDIFYASESAVAWANGKQVAVSGLSDARLPLYSITTDASSGASVIVCGSAEFAAEDYLQSAVFGNSDAVLCALEALGKEGLMIGLHYKPFASSVISSITTSEMLSWTLSLTLIPALLTLGAAIVVLVRRKYS